MAQSIKKNLKNKRKIISILFTFFFFWCRILGDTVWVELTRATQKQFRGVK